MLDKPSILNFPSMRWDDMTTNFNQDPLTIIHDKSKDVPNLNIKHEDVMMDKMNSIKYQDNTITLSNRFIRRPPSKNCSLPPGFPGSPPGWKRLIRICANLDRFSIQCPEDKACINKQCKDPCPGSCGINSNCRVVNHNPICFASVVAR